MPPAITDEHNPYQPPLSPLSSTPKQDVAVNPAELRRSYLQREATIRSYGVFAYLIAMIFFIFVINSLRYVLPMVVSPGKSSPEFIQRFLTRGVQFEIIGLALGSFFVLVGRGLRRQQPWTRWAVLLLLSVLLFLTIRSLATQSWTRFSSFRINEERLVELILGVVQIFTVALLITPRGRLIFSRDYRAAVAATPELTPRMGWMIKIVIAIMTIFALVILLTGVTHSASPPSAL